MATPVIMPKQGQSVESCIISKWYIKIGDPVRIGDILFNYETDKASFDEEAKVSGTVLGIFFNEGDDVPVFTNVCVIGIPGENIDEFIPKSAAPSVATRHETPDEAAQEETPVAAVERTKTKNHRTPISPRAKRRAGKIGIDYTNAHPTGPGGRIIERDILALQQRGEIVTSGAKGMLAGEDVRGTGLGGRITLNDITSGGPDKKIHPENDTPPDFTDIKHSTIRKLTAKAMAASLATTAQLTLHSSFDATSIIDYRKALLTNKEKFASENITITDIILYAVSRTLVRHKSVNAHYFNESLRVFNNTHLGMAVDTERGLLVPTLFNANKKTLNEIAHETKILALKCREGTIGLDELTGGTFTITNLGPLGVEMFTPVLNPPQVGILGINAMVPRVKEVAGDLKPYPAMGISLTFDHRAIDGAPAARFLKDVAAYLENFSALMKG